MTVASIHCQMEQRLTLDRNTLKWSPLSTTVIVSLLLGLVFLSGASGEGGEGTQPKDNTPLVREATEAQSQLLYGFMRALYDKFRPKDFADLTHQFGQPTQVVREEVVNRYTGKIDALYYCRFPDFEIDFRELTGQGTSVVSRIRILTGEAFQHEGIGVGINKEDIETRLPPLEGRFDIHVGYESGKVAWIDVTNEE